MVEPVDGRMTCDSLVDHLSLEASNWGGDVVHGTEDAIGLNQAVGSLGHIPISDLNSRLLVSGDFVGHSVAEFVGRVGINVMGMKMAGVGSVGGGEGDDGKKDSCTHFDAFYFYVPFRKS